MGRFAVFVLCGALGAATAWASRSVRTSEADLLPLVAPDTRTSSLEELEPAPLAAPVPPVAGTPAARAEAAVSWTITQAKGVLRLTPDGEWVDVSPGAPLAVGDQLRTRADGKLVLASPSRGEVSLGPLGRLALRSTSNGVVRLRCSDGLLGAAPKGGPLAVELRAGDALAESSVPFTALCGADRTFVLAAGGQVAVSRGAAAVKLEKGEVATIPASGEIARQKLPPAVELQVDPPQRQEKVALVSGRVSPGTRVRVGDVTAEVDGAGHFSARHPLHVGENRLGVTATDLAGRERTVALAAIGVAPPAPRPVAASLKAPPSGGGSSGSKSKGGFTWGGKK